MGITINMNKTLSFITLIAAGVTATNPFVGKHEDSPFVNHPDG